MLFKNKSKERIYLQHQNKIVVLEPSQEMLIEEGFNLVDQDFVFKNRHWTDSLEERLKVLARNQKDQTIVMDFIDFIRSNELDKHTVKNFLFDVQFILGEQNNE